MLSQAEAVLGHLWHFTLCQKQEPLRGDFNISPLIMLQSAFNLESIKRAEVFCKGVRISLTSGVLQQQP